MVGAGIIGLSTAVQLQDKLGPGGGRVTIVADSFTPNTTGDGALGLWEPYLCGDTPPHKIRLVQTMTITKKHTRERRGGVNQL